MKTAVKLLSSVALAGLMATSAYADYITINADVDGALSTVEYSTSNGDLFDFEESSNDIRLNVNGVSYIVGAKDWFDAPSTGTFNMDKVINDVILDDNYYDDDAGFFTVSSFDISGTEGVDWEIAFSFLLIDDSKDTTLTGSGCIGSTCPPSASEVPVPAAAWLFGSAILGLAGVRRKQA